jgi:hypothetical protein
VTGAPGRRMDAPGFFQRVKGVAIVKKSTFVAVNTRLSYLLGSVLVLILVIPWTLKPVHAAGFFCSSGDVTCLIAAINTANQSAGENTINLDPGIYTLNAVDNDTDGPNGLPSVQSTLTISGAGGGPDDHRAATRCAEFSPYSYRCQRQP